MSETLLIYNPAAGRFRISKDTDYIIAELKNNGYKVDLWSTEGDGSAQKAAEYGAREQYDYIIAMGGDGTLHQVVNGLEGFESKPCLGIIPYGTTNDFANHFNIPLNPKQALEIIFKNKVQFVDLGKANDEYVIYVLAGGGLPSVSYQATRAEKKLFGKLAYIFRGAKNILTYKPFHLKITTDNYLIEDNVSLFVISNVSCIGGIKNLIPDADPSDGYFEVLVVKDVDFTDALDIADAILNRSTFQHPKVSTFKANNLKIEGCEELRLTYDGEAGDFLPVNFSVIPKAIKVLVP
ncbi:MAG TPA: diacylglycerol kinase family lipid kinase [Clostridia bacterium]|nr:diacylglycerol kinase family lipid kinase [Clostridia bacterium]